MQLFDTNAHIFWFGFEDSQTESNSMYDNVYYYQCIILSSSQNEAYQWGKELADIFLQQGKARRIEKCWLEPLLSQKITTTGLASVDWKALKQPNLPGHYQGTAHVPDQPDSTVNVLIEAPSKQIALELWGKYIDADLPEYVIESCAEWYIPITEVGKLVDW